MKNVLVLLHDDPGQEARMQVALDLTRALSGHLNCLDVVVPPAVVGDVYEVAGGAMAMEHVAGREASNRANIEVRLRQEDVSWSMTDRIGAPGRELRKAADLADIIVVSLPGEEHEGDFHQLVGELAVKSDRAVLAVPTASHGLDVAGLALVGWNGSHEASEALRQAVPILKHASSVILLDVDGSAQDYSVEEAASYLSRHGIRSEVVTRESGGNPVSEVILNEAHANHAAYVVIGAYGVPRPVEAILGGVTAGVLQKSNLPILLAH